MNQLMQVMVVRLPGRQFVLELAPPDRVKGLEDRVDQEQQREPWRDIRVADDEEHRKFGEDEADQVGAAIAQEDPPAGPVPDHETQQRARQGQRGREDQQVADDMGNISHRNQHDDGKAAGQAMVAVDDVDGVGHATDGEGGEHHGKRQPQQRLIDAGDIEPAEHGAEQPGGDSTREHGEQEAFDDADLLCDVFHQSAEKGGNAGDQQKAEFAFYAKDIGKEHGPSGGQEADHHRQSADAGRGLGVIFLRAGTDMVVGKVGVQVFVFDDEPANQPCAEGGGKQYEQREAELRQGDRRAVRLRARRVGGEASDRVAFAGR